MPGFAITVLKQLFPAHTKMINLDRQPSFKLKGITSELTELVKLSINYSTVENFQDLPFLPSLMLIFAHHNRIAGNLHNLVQNCPNLRILDLKFNKIVNVQELEPLGKLSLIELDIRDNVVADIQNVVTIFNMIPSLQVLHAHKDLQLLLDGFYEGIEDNGYYGMCEVKVQHPYYFSFTRLELLDFIGMELELSSFDDDDFSDDDGEYSSLSSVDDVGD